MPEVKTVIGENKDSKKGIKRLKVKRKTGPDEDFVPETLVQEKEWKRGRAR